jgi:hypothetical protein
VALEFEFIKGSARYRYKDSKRFVSREAVKVLTRKAIDQTERNLTTIADQLVAKTITVGEWERQTKEGLKQLHVWNYMLGAGGQHNLIDRDYGLMGAKVKNEYKYLRNFAKQLLNGEVSEGQFRYRLNMYVNATDNTHELAINEAHYKAGFRWERRIRTKENSCFPCIGMALAGWRPIGFFPEPGNDCNCRSNCGCYKDFSKEDDEPQQSMLSTRTGFIGAGQQFARSLSRWRN